MVSISNKLRLRRYFALGCAPALLGACFGVDRVELRPISMVDDFEDADLVPRRTGFVDWYCFSFTQGALPTLCDTMSDGPTSRHALSLTYLLEVPIDASDGAYGFGVGTRPSVGTVNLRSYDKFHFSAKVVAGVPSPPEDRLFVVRLGCNTAQTVTGATPIFWVEHSFMPKGEWAKYELPLDEFMQPDWQILMDHPEDCLNLNDSIRFETANSLAGYVESATLVLDDIYFQ